MTESAAGGTAAREGGGVVAPVDVGFEVLAGFPFQAPAYDPKADAATLVAATNEQIPAAVRALDGRRVRVRGFLMSADFSGGRAKEFLILANQMLCCYGVRPKGNEWIQARAPAGGIEIAQDTVTEVTGTLRVGAVIENGFFSRVYSLECETVKALAVVPPMGAGAANGTGAPRRP